MACVAHAAPWQLPIEATATSMDTLLSGFLVIASVAQPVLWQHAGAHVTIILNTFKREDLLRASVAHYSQCSLVRRIHVNWAESATPPDLTADTCCNKDVTFATPSVTHNDSSLNSRFLPISGVLPCLVLWQQMLSMHAQRWCC